MPLIDGTVHDYVTWFPSALNDTDSHDIYRFFTSAESSKLFPMSLHQTHECASGMVMRKLDGGKLRKYRDLIEWQLRICFDGSHVRLVRDMLYTIYRIQDGGFNNDTLEKEAVRLEGELFRLQGVFKELQEERDWVVREIKETEKRLNCSEDWQAKGTEEGDRWTRGKQYQSQLGPHDLISLWDIVLEGTELQVLRCPQLIAFGEDSLDTKADFQGFFDSLSVSSATGATHLPTPQSSTTSTTSDLDTPHFDCDLAFGNWIDIPEESPFSNAPSPGREPLDTPTESPAPPSSYIASLDIANRFRVYLPLQRPVISDGKAFNSHATDAFLTGVDRAPLKTRTPIAIQEDGNITYGLHR